MKISSNYFVGLISVVILSLFTGCFPEDDKEPLIPFGGVIGTTFNSIYTHQSYYSFQDSSELAYNLNSSWDLGFEASTNGEHIILNNSDFLRIANLGAVDFNQTTSVPENAQWLYDASSGNFDSLAVLNWVNTQVSPFEYTRNVYILGRVGDDGIVPFKKFQLVELTTNHYKILIDTLDKSETDSLLINKTPTINFVKVCIRNKTEIVAVEPNSSAWDIQFTQYEDSIPDDNGDLYPYVLRGTFINPAKIKVALYYISTDEIPENPSNSNKEADELKAYFEGTSIIPPADSLFIADWNAIGWEWKKVTINEEANTAYYKADTRRIYFIKDVMNGATYKLRFFSYYSNGVAGFPWFQYIKL